MAESENLPSPSSDCRQWQRIFNSLVKIVQSQQSQIETLEDDRKFLKECLCNQQRLWESRATLLESQISQMEKAEEMGRRVFASKSNLMECMKEREALLYKKQLGIAESDLEAFRACTESLSEKFSEEKGLGGCSGGAAGKDRVATGDPKVDLG